MSARHLLSVLAVLLALTAPAGANQYLGADPADWFRYTESRSGQQVTSRITHTSGGWRLWDRFAGFGARWVYTTGGHDGLWVYDGRTAQYVGDLSGRVGSSRAAALDTINSGRITIQGRGQTLTTPAGTFADVVELALETRGADAGVTGMWFARGVGLVKWVEQSIAGPREYVLSAAFTGGRTYPAQAPRTPTTSARPVAPAEHAPMESVLWGCNDTYMVIDTYTDALAGLHGTGVVSEMIVDSQQTAAQLRYELTAAGVPLDQVQMLVADLDSVWMRDYGPIILKGSNGERLVADLEYYPGRYDDDRFPAAYAVYKGMRRVAVDVGYEGGNFATDGRGLGIASTGIQRFNPQMSRAQIEAELAKLGCDRVVYLTPLVNEGTTHVDMFMRIMDDTRALVSRYPAGNRQHGVCEQAAARLTALGYQVSRVDAATGHDEFATYTNSLLAGGKAFIPVYGDRARDQAALDTYRALGFEPVAVDSSLVIQYGGATHCLSMQVPR